MDALNYLWEFVSELEVTIETLKTYGVVFIICFAVMFVMISIIYSRVYHIEKMLQKLINEDAEKMQDSDDDLPPRPRWF